MFNRRKNNERQNEHKKHVHAWGKEENVYDHQIKSYNKDTSLRIIEKTDDEHRTDKNIFSRHAMFVISRGKVADYEWKRSVVFGQNIGIYMKVKFTIY